MKARVTLVNPPYPAGAVQAPFVPLGLGYLAAYLEQRGFEVNVIDCQVTYPTAQQMAGQLAAQKPDIVGVTTATVTFKTGLDVVRIARETLPNCLTVMGGPHATVLDENTLGWKDAPDLIVRGEGEQTLLELAELVSAGGKDFSKVAGLSY